MRAWLDAAVLLIKESLLKLALQGGGGTGARGFFRRIICAYDKTLSSLAATSNVAQYGNTGNDKTGLGGEHALIHSS
jgi:hypothetical protein